MRRLLFSTGLVSMMGQVLLLRELNSAFYGIELVYSACFAVWLGGVFLGSIIGRRSYHPPAAYSVYLLPLIAILTVVEIYLTRNANSFLGNTPGAFLPFQLQLMSVCILVLPLSGITGLIFQWLAKEYISQGGTLPKAYAIESIGSLIGSLTVTILIACGTGVFTVISVIISAASLSLLYRCNSFKILLPSFCLAFALISYSVFQKDLLNNLFNSSKTEYTIKIIDTPYSRITLTNMSGQINIFENNALVYESASAEAEELPHIAALQCGHMRSALVLGGGYTGVIGELLKYPDLRIDYADYNSALIEFFVKELPADKTEWLRDTRLKISYEDPRRALEKSGRYDMIITVMPEPASGLNNRYYTKEFFRLAAQHLNRGGVFAFRLRSMENYWTPMLKARNGAIFNTLRDVFSSVQVVPGSTDLFIASSTGLTEDGKQLACKWDAKKIPARVVTAAYINYLYSNDRYREIKKTISFPDAEVNSDDEPVCYRYELGILLSKFFPGVISANLNLYRSGLQKAAFLFVLTMLALTIFFNRKKNYTGRILIVFIAGFQGMALQIVLMLIYQTRSGILYQNIGMLMAGFMCGLAIGAAAGQNLWKIFEARKIKHIGIIFIIINLLYCAAVYEVIRSGEGSISAFLLCIICAGVITSVIFSFASLSINKNKAHASPAVYGADVAGGMTAATITNFVLIPFFSLPFTLIILALFALPAVYLVRR